MIKKPRELGGHCPRSAAELEKKKVGVKWLERIWGRGSQIKTNTYTLKHHGASFITIQLRKRTC
jgi:hypothetical protein